MVEGEEFVLTTEVIEGDNKRVSITYEGLVEDAEIGGRILIDDGLAALLELDGKRITTEVADEVFRNFCVGK